MYQIIELTHKQKVKMYKKVKKKVLIEMLIESNKHISLPVSHYGDINGNSRTIFTESCN